MDRESWDNPSSNKRRDVRRWPGQRTGSCLRAFLGVCFLISTPLAAADVQGDITEPQVSSIFPSAARPGRIIEAEVRGSLIKGAYAVWFDDEGLRGRVLRTKGGWQTAQPGNSDKDHLAGRSKQASVPDRVLVEVQIGRSARPGCHSLRLVAPRGLSNGLLFRVVAEPLVIERVAPHQDARQAQPIALPVLINGRISKPGELDYYSFDASQGQEISFEVVRAENFEPHLALYREGGSWFDVDRPTRVLLEQERSSDLMPIKVGGSYRVLQGGRYYVELSSIFGKGSPDGFYELRIALRKDQPIDSDLTKPLAGWEERSFKRRLEQNWVKALKARSVRPPEPAALHANASTTGQKLGSAHGSDTERTQVQAVRATVSLVTEREPNDRPAQAQEVSIPALIEGVIQRPGDIDSFKFKVKPGQKLSFEIETPELKPPLFNPRLGVADNEDRELFSNVHRRISLFNNNGDRQVYLKDVEAKAVYTFERGGEYVLQVRDITSRYGGAGYRYRILVRPQIPHLGEVSVVERDRAGSSDVSARKESDHINLTRGQARKLTIVTSNEEGFTGAVSFWFAGLPEGVQAFPAAEADEGRAPTDVDEHAEAVAAKMQKTTVVLLASPKAPLTLMPKVVRLYCRPIAEGYPGSPLLVQEIRLMVTSAADQPVNERAHARS